MIEFNDKGYIIPANVVETDMDTFKRFFLFNEHRQGIFKEYLVFLEAIQALNINPFYQWINGSFTTLKPKPNDLDVVTFIDFKHYKLHEDTLYSLKQTFRNRYIDSYFVAVYPEDHIDHSLFKNYDYDFWHKFTRDFKKEIRLKTSLKKGFIKINFDNGTRETSFES
jgi:hypothetical protein